MTKIVTHFYRAALTMFALATAASAQSTRASAAVFDSASLTRLEAFKVQAGTMLMKGYTKIQHNAFSLPRVEVIEMKSPQGQPVRGVVIRGGTYNVPQSCYIDPEELPELLRAIETVASTVSNPTLLKEYEVTYRTKDDFSVGTYLDGKKAKYYYRVDTAFEEVKVEELRLLGSVLRQAKDLLDSLK